MTLLYIIRQQGKLKLNRTELENERQILENEKELTHELKRLNTLKDDFLAKTSHELLTPMYGIIGIAEQLIESGIEGTLDTKQYQLELIYKSGIRLANLLRDILDFSRIKHKDIVLNTRTVDLAQLVDFVIGIYRFLNPEKGVSIENLINKSVFVEADEDRLEQILFNLIRLLNFLSYFFRQKIRFLIWLQDLPLRQMTTSQNQFQNMNYCHASIRI